MTRSELRALLFEPIRPRFVREVAGFVVAPLAGAFVLLLVMFLPGQLDELASLDAAHFAGNLLVLLLLPGSLVMMIVYLWALIVALPAYLVLSDLGRIHCASVQLSALLLGAALGALVGAIDDARKGAALLGSLGAASGLVAGFVFYRIISGPRRARLRLRSEASRA